MIHERLLLDSHFRRNIEASFGVIEESIEQKTLWNCGITPKGITIIRTDDGIVDKIIFFVAKSMGWIDTSYASMQDLKQRIKLVELTDIKIKITNAQQRLDDLSQQDIVETGNLRRKTDQARYTGQELDTLNASVRAQQSKIPKLEEEIASKRKELEVLEGKVKAIAKEEELDTRLQALRIASQAVSRELEEITEGIGTKHAELISRIGNTGLGVAGWLANANQMIMEKGTALAKHLSNDEWIKPYDSFEVVLNCFRMELCRLKDQIPLITNSKQYTDFLSELHIIETTGWKKIYYDRTYTVTPESQSNLQKIILREIKELAELTFTRSQIMALTK